jgi:phosphohistidine phosphatase
MPCKEQSVRIYLVRHAIAELHNQEAWPQDGERPLTKRGMKRFRRAAQGLKYLVPSVDRVLSSPYVRAWETARLLNEEADWPDPEACEALQQSPPEEVLRVLESVPGDSSVGLVGHEPYLSALAATLLGVTGEGSILLRKGAVACIDLDVVEWSRRATLLWLLQPRALRHLA